MFTLSLGIPIAWSNHESWTSIHKIKAVMLLIAMDMVIFVASGF